MLTLKNKNEEEHISEIIYEIEEGNDGKIFSRKK